MAKELNRVELIVRGPAGGPYETIFQGFVGSTDDADLRKDVVKVLDAPDFDKTLATFVADEVTALKSDEGIS